MAASFGSGAMTNAISEISQADSILVIGSNTTEQHPLVGTRVFEAMEKGASLYVVDPRRIRLAEFADEYAEIEPGTNLAFVNALIHIIIEEDLYDHKFVAERVENFEAVKKSVENCTAKWAEEITKIPAETIENIARGFAGADKGSVLYAMGITQHKTGTKNVAALANLVMITGNVGREGTGLNPLRGQNNVQGACDMGALPNILPGYHKAVDPATKEKYGKVWGDFSCFDGNKIPEMFDRIDEGKMKALYIMGENPVLSDPDQQHVIHCFEKVDFMVVQDIFLTETAQYADVVLPGTSFLEKDGSFTNTERRAQLIHKALEPIGESKADWLILTEMMQMFGYEGNYANPSAVMDEINTLVPQYGGITYERIQDVGLQWPCPNTDHPGTQFLHKDKFIRGKGLMTVTPYEVPGEQADEEYPLIMTTGRVHHHYHTGTMTREVWTLDREYPGGFVEINPADAKKMGLWDHQMVKISSRRGSITAKAVITDKIKEGVVFVPFHFAESPVNKLTSQVVDPVVKIPEYKVTAVRIEVA
jgi:formate dehydrogenase alpha subunit